MDPPLVGLAVNVTSVPAHTTSPGSALIVTLTGTFAFTVIVIVLLIAGLFVAHGVISDVIATWMASPFAGTVVYVELVAPLIAFEPLYHW